MEDAVMEMKYDSEKAPLGTMFGLSMIEIKKLELNT